MLIDGKREGLWIERDSSGELINEITYVSGKEFGEIRTYSYGGLTTKTSDTIINNDTVTYYTKYHPNGWILEKGKYVNGLRKGVWLKYHSNGKELRSKIDYDGKQAKILIQDKVYPEDY